MRKLFLPACVCLMTWSGATGSDPKLSLDEFYGNARNKDVVAQAAPPEAAAAPAQIDIPQIDIPTDVEAADASIDVLAPQPQSTAIDPDHVPLPPIAKPVVERSHQEICDTLTQAAQSNNVPVPFFISLLFQESRFKAGVVSSAGAQGIAQFMPETATSMGLENPFDPLQAIPASARLLRELIAQFGNLGLAAAAYNAGPKRIQDWLEKKGKLPEETQGYVKTITGRRAETWTAASAAYPGKQVPRHAPCQEAAAIYAAAEIPLPVRSPRHPDAKSASKPTVVAKSADKPASKVASSQSPIKVTHHGGRMTAVIQVAQAGPVAKAAKSAAQKPAAQKPATQQMAARKHKSEKHKPIKLAQR